MLFSDENVPFLIATLTFVVICLFSLGIMIHLRQVRYRRALLKKLNAAEGQWDVADETSDLGLAGGPTGTLARLVSFVGEKISPPKQNQEAEIKLKFVRAGLRGNNVATSFLGAKLLLGALFSISFVFVALVLLKTMKANHMILLGVYFALLGYILPELWLRLRIKHRKERLIRAFPDMLDLLVVCVEAGLGLDAAINRVGAELALNHPDLSHELKQLNYELRAGKSRQSALRNLAIRTDIEDVNSLVTLLLQTDRFGTSVAQALKIFADTFRTARFQRAEEMAAKIAVKIIIPMVLFIFPAMFVVAVGPAVVRIFRVLILKN